MRAATVADTAFVEPPPSRAAPVGRTPAPAPGFRAPGHAPCSGRRRQHAAPALGTQPGPAKSGALSTPPRAPLTHLTPRTPSPLCRPQTPKPPETASIFRVERRTPVAGTGAPGDPLVEEVHIAAPLRVLFWKKWARTRMRQTAHLGDSQRAVAVQFELVQSVRLGSGLRV